MVITVMSTTDDSESGESHQTDELTRVKEKLKVQQRLIDISARTLQSTRLSTDAQPGSSSVIEDNLRDKEAKLMRGFSRQLLLKRQHLKQLSEESSDVSLLDGIAKQLDELISLEQFLNVTGIEPRSIKTLLSGDLTLDKLFSFSAQDLEQLFAKGALPRLDRKRLTKCLEQLANCYDSWENRDNPSVSTVDQRYNSTTSSRLGSLGSFDQDGIRTDSMSSCTSAGNSPRALRASTSHTPTSLTPLSSHTPTPVTPSSTYSLLSPATFTYSTPAGGYEFASAPQTPNSAGSQQYYSRGLNRAHSSSSNVLLESPPYSPGQNQLDPPQLSQPAAQRRSLFSHKRSKSNPPVHSVSQEEEVKDEQMYTNETTGPYAGAWNRSSSPPSRSGSNPSITSYSVHGPGGSPSAIPRNRHPQMRRISGMVPSFSQTISNDQIVPTKRAGMVMSGSESALCRQNTCPDTVDGEAYPRTYSLASAGALASRRSVSSALYQSDTSTSMVDLPVRMHAVSNEHLDQIDEYGRPDSNKSRSVPRLTFMTVSVESEKGLPSTSAPTSPRTPGTYTPTGHMGHAIKHRFTARTFISPHVCDVCKKMVMIGVRCKHCKFKCHKACTKNAPHSCGLPDGLMDFFRKQVHLTSSPAPSIDGFGGMHAETSFKPLLSHGSIDMDVPDSPGPGFVIHELSKEPSSTINFSPVMGSKKKHVENGRQMSELISQTSSTSLLEVPTHRMPGAYRSTSSSPSITPPTSPSLTPSSPRSPIDSGLPIGFPSPPHSQYVRVVFTDESGDESYEDPMACADSRSTSPFSDRGGSSNDISDLSRIETPQGLRPPPQVVAAQSLPDLLNIGSTDHKLVDSRDSTDESNGYFSDDILGGGARSGTRKVSLANTLSTGDSKTSTLVNSNLTEDDSEYSDDEEDYRHRPHRPSIVDEWSIPYEEIRKVDLIGKGPVAEVYKGYWHGEVAIKRVILRDATPAQIVKFKEEVAILKKTRHENLALFMGASLTLPNLAIVTSFCKGQTLYKKIHVWTETFSIDRNLHIANQVAQAMGYLHARGIVAKDLNTKNIFVEKDKVVITDAGLSNIADNFWMQQPEFQGKRRYIQMPHTKLYYMAPELIRVLSPYPEALRNGDFYEYPYTESTDVYAFGTVFYELLFRKFPFSMDIYGFAMDPTSIVYQVGSGKRPDIPARDSIPKRVKELLFDCMHADPKRRLPFTTISDALVKLSRKKTPISRSPSFPTSLSRSSETINFL